MSRCHFIPPYLLEQVAATASAACHSTLVVDQTLRSRRTAPPPVVASAIPARDVRASGEEAWSVFTADGGSQLPGTPVRSAGEPVSGDVAVDEAYAGVEASLALFREVFDRASYDGLGAPVVSTVHYEKNYDNAFWDGRQLVFGDGDEKVFGRFTKPVDVLAHEFTHAVTQYTAGLTYAGQSGALNESISDVFASCVKQRLLGQSAAEADWLIGEGIFSPLVHGRALRSMTAPGTAYDDPVLGRDRQVASMSSFVETADDNGGVHINSGIPNRAFSLAAVALGGTSWEGAGAVWYAALTSGIGPDTDFATFAAATIAAAETVSAEAVSAEAVDGVRSAWAEVGVSASTGTTPPLPPRAENDNVVAVRRTGGFAGVERTGEVRLGDDPRTPEIERLLGRIDVRGLTSGTPQPDRFVYAFWLVGVQVSLGEHELTPELSRLAAIVLDM